MTAEQFALAARLVLPVVMATAAFVWGLVAAQPALVGVAAGLLGIPGMTAVGRTNGTH